MKLIIAHDIAGGSFLLPSTLNYLTCNCSNVSTIPWSFCTIHMGGHCIHLHCIGGWVQRSWSNALFKLFHLILIYSWVACQAALMDGFRGRGAMLCPNTFTWSSSIVGWLARLLWWMGSEVVERCSVQTLSLGPRL